MLEAWCFLYHLAAKIWSGFLHKNLMQTQLSLRSKIPCIFKTKQVIQKLQAKSGKKSFRIIDTFYIKALLLYFSIIKKGELARTTLGVHKLLHHADTGVLSAETLAVGNCRLKANILFNAPMYAFTLETTISIPAPDPLPSTKKTKRFSSVNRC